MIVTDYCRAIERNEIRVNRDYQRSDQVWPAAARSFLIETILLGLPMPKFWLHQITDIKTKTARKEIVDGQQRTRAIVDFLEGKLTLSKTLDLEEARGRTFDELPDDLQQQFGDYGLAIDLFVGATVDDVRDVFRRMNSYTVPLNPEEQRHAVNQGPFKWFIARLARDYSEAFVGMGTFGQKQLIRMADTKLLTEVAHALVHGVQTTKKPQLDKLYKDKDVEFPEEAEFDERFRAALDYLLDLQELHDTELMKPLVLYSLLLAVMHLQRPAPQLYLALGEVAGNAVEREVVVGNLGALAATLDAEEAELREAQSPFFEFFQASSEKTNVDTQRILRLRWLYRALTEQLPV